MLISSRNPKKLVLKVPAELWEKRKDETQSYSYPT